MNTYQTIVVGDVSRVKLARTRRAKAVLDFGWGRLRTQLQVKGENAGRSVRVVSERNTSRTCSACGALTGPAGVNGLRVRVWVCGECRCAHDRDVNAAKNILSRGRVSSSVYGNESSPRHARASRTPRPRKAKDSACRGGGMSTSSTGTNFRRIRTHARGYPNRSNWRAPSAQPDHWRYIRCSWRTSTFAGK